MADDEIPHGNDCSWITDAVKIFDRQAVTAQCRMVGLETYRFCEQIWGGERFHKRVNPKSKIRELLPEEIVIFDCLCQHKACSTHLIALSDLRWPASGAIGMRNYITCSHADFLITRGRDTNAANRGKFEIRVLEFDPGIRYRLYSQVFGQKL